MISAYRTSFLLRLQCNDFASVCFEFEPPPALNHVLFWGKMSKMPSHVSNEEVN